MAMTSDMYYTYTYIHIPFKRHVYSFPFLSDRVYMYTYKYYEILICRFITIIHRHETIEL